MTYVQKKAAINAYKREHRGWRQMVINTANDMGICSIATAKTAIDRPITKAYPPAKIQQVLDLAVSLMK